MTKCLKQFLVIGPVLFLLFAGSAIAGRKSQGGHRAEVFRVSERLFEA